MGILRVIQRLRDEFTAMPGLKLTSAQVARLCSVDRSLAASALCALVSAGFLSPLSHGRYGRADLRGRPRPRPTTPPSDAVDIA